MRRGVLCCHRGHEVCCHCGKRFQTGVDGRLGVWCACPLARVDLIGGPVDGDGWWMPREMLEEARPTLSKGGAGERYQLKSIHHDEGDPLYRYEWVMEPEESPVVIASFSVG